MNGFTFKNQDLEETIIDFFHQQVKEDELEEFFAIEVDNVVKSKGNVRT